MSRLSHRAVKPVRPTMRVGDAIARCERALTKARVYFGHGTADARDEAAELVFFAAKLAHSLGAGAYARPLKAPQIRKIDALLARRIKEHIPLAYLTHRAFFAGLELYVD